MTLFWTDRPPAESTTRGVTRSPPLDEEDGLLDDDQIPLLESIPEDEPVPLEASVLDDEPAGAMQMPPTHTSSAGQSSGPMHAARQNPDAGSQVQPSAQLEESLHAYWRSPAPGSGQPDNVVTSAMAADQINAGFDKAGPEPGCMARHPINIAVAVLGGFARGADAPRQRP